MAQDPPTILQIIPQLDAGGAELSAVEIADAVVRAGGRAIVLAEPGRLAADITAVGGEVMPFPAATKNPLRMLANARAIVGIVAKERVSLVHARSRAPAWSALWAARRAGVPFVTTYHGAYGEKNAAKKLYNSVMARGDVVIANSRYTARLIVERYATPGGRIEVIPRGVDVHRFDPEAIALARVDDLRARWGVHGGPAGHPAGGAPDDVEGAGRADRRRSQTKGGRAARLGGGGAGRRCPGPGRLRARRCRSKSTASASRTMSGWSATSRTSRQPSGPPL